MFALYDKLGRELYHVFWDAKKELVKVVQKKREKERVSEDQVVTDLDYS